MHLVICGRLGARCGSAGSFVGELDWAEYVCCGSLRVLANVRPVLTIVAVVQAIQLEVENEEKEHAAQYDPQLPSE
jgi:hypothetical protein